MVAPCGNTVQDAWNAAVNARTGVGPITKFTADDLPVRIAAEVKNFEIGDVLEYKEARRTTMFVQFAAKAATEALHDSGLSSLQNPRDNWGVSVGVGMGGIEDIENNTLILKEHGPKRVSPFFMPYVIANMATGVVSKILNFRGPNICTTTACSSGTHGVGEAFLYIRNNLADVMIAGGSEAAISRLSVSAFASMKALSSNNDNPQQASCPFDKDRDGFVMGEGAGLLVLEELEHAKKRGAKIYAEVVGYGMSGDAHHITAPAPEGEGAQRCMQMALNMGQIAPDKVDYINAHGTSTPMNDKFESQAIQKVFGAHAGKVSISSTKGVTGHCLGAAGGIEAVFTALAISHALVPPTANYRTPDPDCPLDYTPKKAKERRIDYALSNSFGFGGTNATIAMRRFQ
jgi:3-oxoacyl-[acyl-carrier-protein] synthase II